jgi:hypothetical protein
MDVDASCASLATAPYPGIAVITGPKTLTTGVLTLSSSRVKGKDCALSIGRETTLTCTSIAPREGTDPSNGVLTVEGTLKNSGATIGLSSLRCRPGSTVEYNGAAQTVLAIVYSNLTLSGSGTKTLAGTTMAQKTFTIDSNVTLNTNNQVFIFGDKIINSIMTDAQKSNRWMATNYMKDQIRLPIGRLVSRKKAQETVRLTRDVKWSAFPTGAFIDY